MVELRKLDNIVHRGLKESNVLMVPENTSGAAYLI